MHPEAIAGISPILLVLCVVVLSCTLMQVYLLRSESAKAWQMMLFFFGTALAAIIGAKLYSLGMRGVWISNWEREIVTGWRYPGAMIAAILALPILKRLCLPKVSYGKLFDVTAIAVALGAGLFRAHCFLVGCCTGNVCDTSWCLTYARGSSTWWRHYHEGLIPYEAIASAAVLPLHVLYSIASLVTFGVLYYLYSRQLQAGRLIFWYLIIHEAGKGSLELLRDPFQPALFYISIAFVFVGIFGLISYKYFNLRFNR